MAFILGTGLRAEELCGLRWIDVQKDQFQVAQVSYSTRDIDSGTYYTTTNAPKTKAGKRLIPLNQKLRAILDEQRAAQSVERLQAGSAWHGGQPGKGETSVFASSRDAPADRNNLNRTLRRILDSAGLNRRGVHALRHTFATNWVQEGKNLRALSEIFGHTSVAFTMQRYAHADMSMKAEAMESMGELLYFVLYCIFRGF